MGAVRLPLNVTAAAHRLWLNDSTETGQSVGQKFEWPNHCVVTLPWEWRESYWWFHRSKISQSYTRIHPWGKPTLVLYIKKKKKPWCEVSQQEDTFEEFSCSCPVDVAREVWTASPRQQNAMPTTFLQLKCMMREPKLIPVSDVCRPVMPEYQRLSSILHAHNDHLSFTCQ